jgi:DUF1680 family protein
MDSPVSLRLACLLLASLGLSPARSLAQTPPLPEQVPCAVQDIQAWQEPDQVRLEGFLGERILGNESERLLNVDTNRLLEGYRKRPGRQSWDGEHVGKWLHAATLAWVNTGDARLRAKLDATAAALAECQQADGYLGTYLPADRWTEWDVWAHKYNLLGLLTYMRYTGDLRPMPVCRRMADLLCSEFGDGPGRKDLVTQGGLQHVGMASSSVLEPMVLLYRLTGERRYLDFCQYILRDWETPAGPRILSTLLAGKGVNAIGDAKAYEMLSCLNGVLELHRTTGDATLLRACEAAWEDIAAHRLYLTGTASWREVFHGDFDLRNADNTGETCVTVTWIQFNAQLLRLTGEARFAAEIERSSLNQLIGAQHPGCREWSYYVGLEGVKRYTDNLDGQCCLSSGPRALALLPTLAVTRDGSGLVLNLYDRGHATVTLPAAGPVSVSLDTQYPADGRIVAVITPQKPASFTLRLRIPEWARGASATVNGEAAELRTGKDGYALLSRWWNAGDRLVLELPMRTELVVGDHGNTGRFALRRGPLVFALEEASLTAYGQGITTVRLAGTDLPSLGLQLSDEPQPGRSPASGLRLTATVTACRPTRGTKVGDTLRATFVPFSEAGGGRTPYRVWVPGPQQGPDNLLPLGTASCSEAGQDCTVINDDNQGSNIELIGADRKEDAWFAVSLPAGAKLTRFVYVSGSEHWAERGTRYPGWFDSSAGKPRIEIRRTPDADWEAVGTLDSYPQTSATDSAGIRECQHFELVLPKAVEAVAVRVIGRPCEGGTPAHSRLSIGELEAYGTW